MYKIKNKNKGVKISLIVALFAALVGCLVLLASNPFSVAEKASADTSVNAEVFVADDGISAQSAESLAAAWNTVVQESLDGNGKQMTFTLTENWTAQPDATYTTSFGTGAGFSNGRLYVPAGSSVVLDLNGYTIDRSLTAYSSYGGVICVDGTLEIKDSVGGGKITGGWAFTNYVSGGGVYVSATGNLTLSSGTITGNNVFAGGSSAEGGGVFIEGTFTMNGGEISYNEAKGSGPPSDGGGVSVSIGGTFTMNDGIIVQNAASRGGGVWLGRNANFTMNGGEIANNTSYYGGGVGVYNDGAFTMTGGTISGNTANPYGGGVYLNGTFKFEGGIIIGNTAPQGNEICYSDNNAGLWASAVEVAIKTGLQVYFVLSGNLTAAADANYTTSFGSGTGFTAGRLHVPAGANIVLDLGTYNINRGLSTSVNHGSVMLVEGTLEITGTSGKITGGNCTDRGGGIFIANGGEVTMSGGVISGNRANSGGGVAIWGGKFIMNGGTITGNEAHAGAGLNVYADSEAVMNGGAIINNTADNYGGGVYVTNNGLLTFTGGEIKNNHIVSTNTTDAKGGAIALNGSGNLVMTGGTVSGNSAFSQGGAIWMWNNSTAQISGGTFSDNSSYAGGAIWFGDSSLTLTGGTISGNTGTVGGGVCIWGCTLKIGGAVIIYDNYNGSAQNNVYVSNSSIIEITGSLVGSKIGVTMQATTGTITSGFGAKNTTSYATLFFYSDVSGYKASYTGDGTTAEVTIISGTQTTPTLTIEWRYSTDSTFATYESATDMSASIPYDGLRYYVRAYRQDTGAQITISAYSHKLLNGATSTSSSYTVRYAGTYSFVVNSASYTNPAFSLTIAPKEVEISWSDTELVYNGNMQYPTASISGKISSDSVTFIYDTSKAGTNAGGGYIISASLSTTNSVSCCYRIINSTSHSYSISKVVLSKPVVSGYSTFTYSGAENALAFSGFNRSLMALGGTYAATNAGSHTAKISITDKTNYVWVDGANTDAEYTWRIVPKYIYISGISVESKAYDGTDSATVDTSNITLGGVVDADKDKLTVTFTGAGNTFDGSSVGLHYVIVSGLALKNLTDDDVAANYEFDFEEVKCYAQIYPATITISGVMANDKAYDGTTSVTFDASGAQITGAVADEISDLITNLIVSGYFDTKNAGEGVAVTVTGYRLGGQFAGNYIVDFENSEKSLTADITRAQVEVTLGATEYTVTYGNGLKITYSQNSPVKSESVNLALEYYDEHGNVKLSGVPTDAGKYLVKVVVDADDANVGNYTIKTTGEGLISEATVTIEKAALTVTVEDLEIEYGSAKPADGDYTLVYNGWLNGDKASFENGSITFITAITISTDYEQYDDADGYEIALSDGELKNYEITYVNGTLNVVAKKVTVTISDKSSAYGAEEAELTSDEASVAVNGDDLQITLTRADATNVNVGKYAITGSAANANYNVTFVNGVYEITKAKLTVTAHDNTITYGDKATADGATYSGFATIGGVAEDESVLGGELGFRYTYTQYGDIYEADGVTEINYYIIPYGLTSDNYEIEYENGLLTVEKKTATVTVTNAASDITSVPADRTEAAEKMKYAVSGAVNGDDLHILLEIAENGENGIYTVSWCAVGVYKVTGSAGNANYDVTFVYENGESYGTYTVSQGTLIITANTLILSYGDSLAFGSDVDTAVTAEGLPVGSTLKDLIASGVISGSLKVVAYGDAAYDEYAAMGSAYRLGDDIFDASGNRISYIVIPTGLSSSSYNIEFKPGRLMIEPKSIMVTLDNKTSVYGEADKELTASVADGALVNFDPATDNVADFLGITGLMRAAGADAGNYAITATGADNKNYRVTFVNGVYTITQYEVEIKWISGNADDDDFNYVYNALEQAPVATFEMPDGTVYKSTDLTDRFIEVTGSGLNAGDYKAQAFLLNSNLKFKSGTDTVYTFTIAKKQLGVKWYKSADDIGDENKVVNPTDTIEYGYRVGYPYAPVVELSGIEAADNVSGFYYVSGEQSAVSITPYVAELHILNSNYSIAIGDAKIYFTIVKSAPGGFAWYDKLGGEQVSGKVEYTYNGEMQHPVAAALQNEDFVYTIYVIAGSNETKVTSTVNVGSYKIVAKPVDNNLELTSEEATLYFEIVAMEVTVVWSDTSFEYNGKVQVPTAYYTDALGQKVSLTVSGDKGVDANEDGSVYNVSVTLDTPNYTFVVDGAATDTLEATYTITAKEITVSWTSKYTDDDGNAKWEIVYDNSDESESVTALISMKNEVEKVGLTMKVWYQANENDAPVQVNAIKNAGIYTLCVELANDTPNYKITDSEQTFRIAKRSLTFTAEEKQVNTGEKAPVLTATFGGDGFANGEDAESLGLVGANGGISWLATNYNLNSPYIAESEYTKPEDIEKLETLADINGYKGYFIVLTDSEARLKELNAILSNYDWSFAYGRMIIIAVEGDVSIVLTQSYNGEDQLPAAKYKVGDEWLDLKVEVYTDSTYTEKVENPEVKDVGEYYILLKKYTDDNVTLEGADENGNVKKVFTITQREIKVNISDKSIAYGEVTNANYTDYLATLWAFASSDALYRPLDGDELDISLAVEFDYDAAGYAVVLKVGDEVAGYEITGRWSEDETLRKNYNVVFVGSNGDKGAFTITNAKISFYEKTGEFDQIIEKDGSMKMALAEMQDGVYKYFAFSGNTDASVEIYYSNPYSLDNNNPDSFPPEKDVMLINKLLSVAPDFYRTGSDSKYFVNFMIVIANHETYYGQWTAEVLNDTVYIRILFVKEYGITYGDSVPDGKTLADALWNGGYIDKNGTGIQNKFQEYIDNGIVTARVLADYDGLLGAGAYTIVFEGLENVTDGKYEVTYRQNLTDGVATNLNKFVVKKCGITLTWDKTTFEYDGKAHLPTPSIAGWNMTSTVSDGNGTVYTFLNEANGATLSLKVRTNGGDFTSVGGENIVIAEIDNENYALDTFNATRAVSIVNGLEPVNPAEPTVGGVPAWVIGLLAGIAAVLLVALIIAILKKRKTATAYSDDDGFYDDVTDND
ncbi:MAG: hypothetical protein K2I29_06140 [Clostridia bacterium]|nr:hypothetical protein [Clostridia bacterium]